MRPHLGIGHAQKAFSNDCRALSLFPGFALEHCEFYPLAVLQEHHVNFRLHEKESPPSGVNLAIQRAVVSPMTSIAGSVLPSMAALIGAAVNLRWAKKSTTTRSPTSPSGQRLHSAVLASLHFLRRWWATTGSRQMPSTTSINWAS